MLNNGRRAAPRAERPAADLDHGCVPFPPIWRPVAGTLRLFPPLPLARHGPPRQQLCSAGPGRPWMRPLAACHTGPMPSEPLSPVAAVRIRAVCSSEPGARARSRAGCTCRRRRPSSSAAGAGRLVLGVPEVIIDPALDARAVPAAAADVERVLHRLARVPRQSRRASCCSAVGAVIFTTLAVGVVVHWVVPALPWAVCFALGAIGLAARRGGGGGGAASGCVCRGGWSRCCRARACSTTRPGWCCSASPSWPR